MTSCEAFRDLDRRVGLGLGVIDIKDNEIESADLIAQRMEHAAKMLESRSRSLHSSRLRLLDAAAQHRRRQDASAGRGQRSLSKAANSRLALSALVFAAAAHSETLHLSNIRQLTSGGQNAEAYWSPDGQRLIFQSTRPPYDCDQIFIMNADGSDPHLVSTGKGRTTCGYFFRDGKHIVYASTHEAAEACPKPPDRSKGYSGASSPATIFSSRLTAGKF